MPEQDEQPIDPERPIVDPHHHLWDVPAYPGHMPYRQCFLLEDMLTTVARSGHNITHTVYAECWAMYRADGPVELRPVGEVEFANGMAAMSASGRYGPSRIVAGIIGTADLRLGDRVKPVLEALIAAGGGRLRAIRTGTAYVEKGLFGMPVDPSVKGIMLNDAFRKGAGALAPLDLSLDVWCVHPQIPELADLAAALPQTTIVLDHVGSPLDFSPETFAAWKAAIVDLARRPNVVVKLGGLGMDLVGAMGARNDNLPSATVAATWRPYVETCIAAFGPDRCMFESNYPPEKATCSYGAVWNAFKRITAGYGETEKTALFSGTAKRVYRLT